MKRKTHTFYTTESGFKSDSRKLKIETLLKLGAIKAYYQDIDQCAPSRGYFNKREINLKLDKPIIHAYIININKQKKG